VAFDGPNATVNPEVAEVVKQMLDAGKPIGALCISPAFIARIIGDEVEVTIGSDPGTASAINSMGGVHVETSHGEVVFDKKHNVYTTPCYMLDATIVDIDNGATNVVRAMMEGMG
jgi:enhancing lycopene biosynthesis protein 2